MPQDSYIVVGFPPTRTIRVIWALEEMGLAYDIEPARPHTESISNVNPSGKVPALKVTPEDGAPFEVIDSVAIVQFLADRQAKLTYPAGTPGRAAQDSFTQFACDEIDGTLWQMAKHTFVLPEELRHLNEVKPGCIRDLDRAFDTLAIRLGDSAYVMGDQLTVPDILITHCCGWAERSDYPIKQPPLIEYIKRCHARPAYQRTMDVRNNHLK